MYSKRRRPDGSIEPEQKFRIRISEGLHEALKDKAKLNHRSFNAEIVHRIAEGFDNKLQKAFESEVQCKDLDVQEDNLLASFRLLSSEKRLALLALIADL